MPRPSIIWDVKPRRLLAVYGHCRTTHRSYFQASRSPRPRNQRSRQ